MKKITAALIFSLFFSSLFLNPVQAQRLNTGSLFFTVHEQNQSTQEVETKNQTEICTALEAETSRNFCEKIVDTKGFLNSEQYNALLADPEEFLLEQGCTVTLNAFDLREFCRKQLAIEKKKITERNTILQMAAGMELNTEFCGAQSDYDNFMICEQKRYEQEQICGSQKTGGTQIIIDLEHQILYGIKDCRVIVYTRVITGKNSTPTWTGNYKIQEKRGPHRMQGIWYVEKALYYHYTGFAIHDAGWRNQPRYWDVDWRAYGGSHGCTNTPKTAVEIMWENFAVGDPVHVYRTLPEDIAQELGTKVQFKTLIDPSTAG